VGVSEKKQGHRRGLPRALSPTISVLFMRTTKPLLTQPRIQCYIASVISSEKLIHTSAIA